MRVAYRVCLSFVLSMIGCAASAAAPTSPSPETVATTLKHMAAADKNGDGATSLKEWQSFRATEFSRLDGNGDGHLSLADIPVYAQGLGPGDMFKLALEQFDVNQDKRLSREEFVEGPTSVFDALDTNQDDLVDPQEKAVAAAPEN